MDDNSANNNKTENYLSLTNA